MAKKLEPDLEDEKDEFDMMVTDKEANRRLSDKLGYTPEKKKAAVKREPKASPASKKSKKSSKNPWDSDSDSDSLKSSGEESFDVEKKDRDNIRRKAATTKYKDYMSGSNSDSEDSFTVVSDKKNGVSFFS